MWGRWVQATAARRRHPRGWFGSLRRRRQVAAMQAAAPSAHPRVAPAAAVCLAVGELEVPVLHPIQLQHPQLAVVAQPLLPAVERHRRRSGAAPPAAAAANRLPPAAGRGGLAAASLLACRGCRACAARHRRREAGPLQTARSSLPGASHQRAWRCGVGLLDAQITCWCRWRPLAGRRAASSRGGSSHAVCERAGSPGSDLQL